MAELKIQVDGKLNTDLDKYQEILKKGFEKGGISQKQYTRASSDISQMKQLTAKGSLSPQEVKELEKSFNAVSKVVDMAAKSIVSLTDEAKAAAKRIKEATEKTAKAREKLETARTGKQSLREQYAARLKEKGQVVTRNGKAITNLETLSKAPKDSLEIYKDGKQITGGPATNALKFYEELAKSFRERAKEEAEANKIIAEAAKERKAAEDDYNEQLKKDISAGRTKDEAFSSDAVGTKASIAESIGGMQADLSQQKEDQSILESANDISALTNNTKESTSALGKLTKQVGLTAIAFRFAKKAISEVKATITELDKSLTEQAMVTGKTRKEVYGMLGAYQDLAIQTGSTTKEISATVTEFVRQGKTFEEAMTLAEAATSAAKVAGISSADSVNYLTTALNGFRLSAEQAMSVSDKFAAISASAATSYEEIAIALSKVASQANLAGMSIDYTTALLAKGLETTREAPETIGTALKTIIARMREITDYGETLEDGVDINNVESQLSYVGVALRTVSGELRSTEDVLNDLGEKWDTLSSNQQAAVAKALAGTRQQSRLIAMMSDYERVIELQEIATQSSGATLAQMAIYSEGLEAALNRLSTQWEKIISTISNSDVITDLVDFASFMLDTVNNILNNTFGMVAVVTTIGLVAVSTLASKIQEQRVQKMLLKGQLEQRKVELEKLKVSKEQVLQEKIKIRDKAKQAVQDKQAIVDGLTKQLNEAKSTKDVAKQAEIQLQLKQAQAELVKAKHEERDAQREVIQAQREVYTVTAEIGMVQNEITLNSGGLLDMLNRVLPIVSSIMTVMTVINTLRQKGIALTKKQTAEDVKNNTVATAGLPAKVMGAASSGFIPGLIFGLAILTALGIGIGVAVAQFNNLKNSNEEAMKSANAEIYNIGKNLTSLSSTIGILDEIDKKLIKSAEDAKAYADELEKVSSILSSDANSNILDLGGLSEKEFYESLSSDEDKREFIDEYTKAAKRRSAQLRDEQRTKLLLAGGINGNTTNRLTATSLIRNDLYEGINNSQLTTQEKSAIRQFMDNIVDEMNDSERFTAVFDKDFSTTFLKEISNIRIGENELAADVLADESRGLRDRAEAYQALKDAVGTNSEWIEKAYDGWDDLLNVFNNPEALEALDKLKIDFNDINDLYARYDVVAKKIAADKSTELTLQSVISESDYQKKMIEALSALDKFNGDVGRAINETFKDVLGTGEEYTAVWSAIFEEFGNVLQVGVQNIGQSADKLQSTIKSYYDKAAEWSGMSNTDKSTYIAEHAAEFAAGGDELLQALETQDYEKIEAVLKQNEAILEQRDAQIRQIKTELDIEEGKKGSARNEANIKFLRETLAQLESDTFFQVDLETLVEQQNKRIEAYKELLEKEEELLTKSLEERKSAYESYFESIGQQQEDEDYEEKSELLATNLAKLAGSTSMSSKNQMQELQDSLAELEKERLDTLRQRAQEAVIQSIDDTISNIEESFSQLLENNREILNILKGTSGEDLVSNLLSQDSFASMTAAEAQQYLGEIQSTFGNQVSGIDWSNISVGETAGGQLTLNIGDQVIQLSGEEAQGRNIKEAVMTALLQNGINGGSL